MLRDLTPRSSSAVSIGPKLDGHGPSTIADVESLSQKASRRNRAKKKARVKRISKLFSKCCEFTKLLILTISVVLLVYFTLIFTDVIRVQHFLTIRNNLGMKGTI